MRRVETKFEHPRGARKRPSKRWALESEDPSRNDRNDVVFYFNSQARARRSFGALKIAFVCFTPYQNACRCAIFCAIKNLKLLRIFSRFIGFNGIFSCFFLGLHNPTTVPPLQSCPAPTSMHFRPPTTVSTHPRHCLDIVYMCLHPPAPNNNPPAWSAV